MHSKGPARRRAGEVVVAALVGAGMGAAGTFAIVAANGVSPVAQAQEGTVPGGTVPEGTVPGGLGPGGTTGDSGRVLPPDGSAGSMSPRSPLAPDSRSGGS